MLNLSFAGTLGADPETRSIPSGSEVTEFRVAVNGYDFSKREKTTTWLKVTIWGQRGPKLAELCAKGDKVAGSGQFSVETYRSQNGEQRQSFKVTCQELTLQGGRPRETRQEDDEPPQRQQRQQQSSSRGRAAPPPADDFDDDVPF